MINADSESVKIDIESLLRSLTPLRSISMEFDQIYGYLSQFIRVFLKASRASIISCSSFQESYYYLFAMAAFDTLITVLLMEVVCSIKFF